MRKVQAAVLAALLVTVCVLSAGCTTYDNFKNTFFSEKGSEEHSVRIGVLEPQTGTDSENGKLEIRGIELANGFVPEVLGRKVELVYTDTQSSIYVTESSVEDLLAKKPAAVLGSSGEAVSLTASRILGEAKVPAVSATATNPLITGNNRFYFTVMPTDAGQGEALADYTVKGLEKKKAAVVKVTGKDAATEMSASFSDRLVELTGNEDSSSVVEIPQGAKNLAPYAKELKESGAETVFMPVSLNTAGKFLAAAREAGLAGLTFLGPAGWHSEELISLQEKYPEITLAAVSAFSREMAQEDKAGKELYERFRSAYSREYGEKEPPEAAARAFDAYMLLVSAIEKAGSTDGEKIRAALQETKNFSGVCGTLSFNEDGEPKKSLTIDVVQAGAFVPVFSIE